MIGDNRYYGHADILRRYCGVKYLPIPGRLQHGWQPGPGMAPRLFDEPWSKFVWSRRNLDQCSGYARVVPIGAPYLYLPTATGTGRGLLAVPFHGWEKAQLHGDMSAYADALTELDFERVTVCLYWMEYENPAVRRIFEERGFRVITNGNRSGDPDFLRRQQASILDHEVVTSNRASTALFYALASGRKALLHGPPMGLSETLDPTGEEYDRWQRTEFPHLDQSVGLEELGAEFKRSPEELRDLFDWSLRRGPSLIAAVVRRAAWRATRRAPRG